jgi:hypothetical protein
MALMKINRLHYPILFGAIACVAVLAPAQAATGTSYTYMA